MFLSLQTALWVAVPLLLAVWLLLPRRKRQGNLPKMVEKGYSNFTGHIGYVIGANNRTQDQYMFNVQDLMESGAESVMALYVFGPKWLSSPLYFVKDPLLISAVLNSKVKRFGSFTTASANVIGSKSLSALHGAEMKRHRKLLTSSILARKVLARFVEIMSEEAASYFDTLPMESSFDLELSSSNDIGMLVVDAFSAFSFGVQTTSRNPTPEQVERRKRLHASLQFTFKMFAERLADAGFMKHLSYLNLRKNWGVWRNKAFIRNEFILPAIRQRKADMQSGVNVPNDALTCMLEASDSGEEGFSDEEICDEAMLVIVAGYETTAMSFLWALYHLALHPEHQELCYKEITEVMSKQAPGAQPSITDIDQMAYVSAAIQESMRLTPIALSLSRGVDEGGLQVGEYRIPHGAEILCYYHLSSQDDDVFENASQFVPGRWKDDPTGGAKKPGAVCIPFGQGQYRCFGQPLALQAMRTLIAVWIQRYRFELVTEDVKPAFRVGYIPTNLQLKMSPR